MAGAGLTKAGTRNECLIKAENMDRFLIDGSRLWNIRD